MPALSPISRRGFLTGCRQSEGESRAVVSDACLARSGISCMSCRDACEFDAIRFRPLLGSPFAPEIDAARCTACGDCLEVCPVSALGLSNPCADTANA